MPKEPVVPIDWKRADKLLEAGCRTSEVAAFFGVHRNTLYARCLKEKKIEWTAYSAEKREKGCTLLREKQVELALGGCKTMLVWLGKQRLDQNDTKKIEHTVIEKENEITQE